MWIRTASKTFIKNFTQEDRHISLVALSIYESVDLLRFWFETEAYEKRENIGTNQTFILYKWYARIYPVNIASFSVTSVIMTKGIY